MSQQPEMTIPFVPENAPFTSEQRNWLNGFLADLFSQAPAATEQAPAASATILFGSQTGNAEMLAKQATKQLKAAGVNASSFDMEAYDPANLHNEENLLIITSTYGDGEPPDNAAGFHEFIMSDTAPKLEKVKYSVMALGDSSYPGFCTCGKDFDARLAQLGATRMRVRVDADVDFDEPFEEWMKPLAGLMSEGAGTAPADEETAPAEEAVVEYGKKNPFPSPLVDNHNLNGQGSKKETRHIAFSLEGSGLSYEAGDALAVLPLNHDSLVDSIIEKCGLPADAQLEGGSTLSEALTSGYEITRLSAKILAAYAEMNNDSKLKELAGDKAAAKEYCEGRDLLDLFQDFVIDGASADQLVAPLKKLPSRLYSISSSPLAHPGEVHLTVGRVAWDSYERTRFGVCSDFLARIPEGTEVGVYVHTNKNFRPPADLSQDAIMVGPGTGIAPFRAFVEDRVAKEASGRNWLFFGDQKASCDFLYRETMEQWLRDGALTRLETAFSRDQEEKIYVQNRMLENGAELFAWLDGGASFYVCGDASRMAKDVDSALHQIVEEYGKMSTDEAVAYVKQLKKDKRYQRDVY